MKNLGQMMKKAQEMQSRMAEIQEGLANVDISGASGGGLVTVTLSGKGEMKHVKIDPMLLKPDDIEVLEDLIVAAHNDAKGKVESHIAEQMSELTGGLKLPPGFTPPF